MGADMKGICVCAVSLLLLSCASKAGTAAKPQASSPSAPAPPGPEVTYYRGLSAVALTTGQTVGTIEVLLKRSLDPARGTITEQIAQRSSKKGEIPVEFAITSKVSGNHYTSYEPTLGIQGEGDLVGDPWKWKSWTSHSVLQDGSSVDATFTREGSGLQAEKEVRGPLGVLRLTMSETYQPLSAEVFELGRSEMLGVPAAQSADGGTPAPEPR